MSFGGSLWYRRSPLHAHTHTHNRVQSIGRGVAGVPFATGTSWALHGTTISPEHCGHMCMHLVFSIHARWKGFADHCEHCSTAALLRTDSTTYWNGPSYASTLIAPACTFSAAPPCMSSTPPPPVSSVAAEPPTPITPPRVLKCILRCIVKAKMATLYQGACALSCTRAHASCWVFTLLLSDALSYTCPSLFSQALCAAMAGTTAIPGAISDGAMSGPWWAFHKCRSHVSHMNTSCHAN